MLHFLDPNPEGRPAVLLLHGLGVNAESWSLQIPALCDAGFRPIAPDFPGFGASLYDGRGWTIHRMAAEMAGLVNELDCGPVDVVGLSMGGTIAQQFALDYPDLTRKLVLISTFAVIRPDSLNDWIYFLYRFILVNTVGLPAQAKYVALRIFPDPSNARLREILIETISQADPRAYRKAMASLGLFNSVKQLRYIQAPTLVVMGETDTTVSPSHQQILVNGIPNSSSLMIANAGHAVPVDQPGIFNRNLLDFLGQK